MECWVFESAFGFSKREISSIMLHTLSPHISIDDRPGFQLCGSVLDVLSISLKEKYACVKGKVCLCREVAWCSSVAEMRDHANHFSHCNSCVNYMWTVLETTEFIPVILAMTPPNVVLLACGAFNPPTNMHLRMFGEFV